MTPIEVISVEGATVRFGELTAIDDVDLRAPQGSITGLIGRNGAGKSTTIRVLAGLLQPVRGTVRVLGRDFTEGGPEIRRQVGYLLDVPALFSYLTVEETLLFLAEAYGLSAAEGRQRAEDLLLFFGLQEARSRLVDDFSTGLKKRLALASALIHSPSLLVLDEPFESLDPLMVRRLKRLLTDFVGSGGSVLLSSHLIGAVEEICDRIVILERGRVVVAGPTREALREGAAESGTGSLEELYASVVADVPATDLNWLRPRLQTDTRPPARPRETGAEPQ